MNPSNSATLQPLINDLNAQIQSATNGTANVASTVLGYTPAQWNANHEPSGAIPRSGAGGDGRHREGADRRRSRFAPSCARPSTTTPTTAGSGDSAHSARSMRAVGVRAALRAGIGGHGVGQDHGGDRNEDDPADRDRRFGHGVDQLGEQNPQPPTQDDPDGHADHDPDQRRHRGLPRDCGGQLSLGETERLQER